MEIRPIGHSIVVEPLSVEQYSSGGLAVPATVHASIPPQQGLVLSVGDKVVGLTENDRVVYALDAGVEVTPQRRIIQQSDVVCRILPEH